MQILIGLIFLVLGAFMTVKADWFSQNFGILFAERLFSSGRSFYQFLGIVISVLGILIMTNLLGGIFFAIFGTLFKR
jgi:hypothetical protein